MKAISSISFFLLQAFDAVKGGNTGEAPSIDLTTKVHRSLNETEDCFPNSKKFKYEHTKISCTDVAANATICNSSWKAGKKCEACGKCTPEVEGGPEDCFPDFKKFKYEDTKISCTDVTANPTLCDASWKAGQKCETCGKCTPEVEGGPEDCFPGFKKFKYEDTRISCDYVAANVTLCDSSWKAGQKCEACGKCTPEVEGGPEDCFPGFKKFPYEDTRISCDDVAANATLCDSSWKASQKCETCGKCTPEVEGPDDCFPDSKEFDFKGTMISCTDVAANATLCDSSWKAGKKCEICGKCTPEVEGPAEDCFPGFKKFDFKGTRISCNSVAVNTTLCDISWKAGEKCEACGKCTPEVEGTEDCYPDSKTFKFQGADISCGDVAVDATLCDIPVASKKCQACGKCTPEQGGNVFEKRS